MNNEIKLRGWSSQEDAYLKFIKEEEKVKTWKKIANEMNKKFPTKIRSQKQCRQRYDNYARFQGELSTSWGSEEEKLIIQSFLKIGPFWRDISQYFIAQSKSGKTWSPNFLKNKFYNALRKFAHDLNNFELDNPLVKFQTIQRILSLRILTQGELYGQLADKILKISQDSSHIITKQEAQQIRQQIRSFNKSIKIPINGIRKKTAQPITNKTQFGEIKKEPITKSDVETDEIPVIEPWQIVNPVCHIPMILTQIPKIKSQEIIPQIKSHFDIQEEQWIKQN